MADSAPYSSVLAPVQGFLLAPDAPSDNHPMGPAAALAVSMAGVGVFGAALVGAVTGLDLEAVQGSGLERVIPAFLVGVPLAQLLCFPPLYLWSTLQGQRVPPLRLAAAVTAGPGAMGAWMGAASPLFLLYALSGPVGEGRSSDLPSIAVLLLGLAVAGTALLAGARNAVRAGASLGLEAPGAVARLAHFVVVLWTTLILVIRLST